MTRVCTSEAVGKLWVKGYQIVAFHDVLKLRQEVKWYDEGGSVAVGL